MKVSLFIALILSIVLTGCFKGEGQVRIDSDIENAIIYIDGDKKGMTGDGYTTIIIEEGNHEVRIYKEKDKEWFYEGTQNIFVGANSSVKVKIDTDKKPTEFRLKILEREKLEERAKERRETFTDSGTELMWQNASYHTAKRWKASLLYCQDTEYAGFSNWRLPSVEELKKLYTKKENLKISNADNYSIYWSSTPYKPPSSSVWVVFFSGGDPAYYNVLEKSYVRCVRENISMYYK
jgi:hypothetical protein